MPTYDLNATTNINTIGTTPGFDVKDGESLELAAGGIIKAEGAGINYTRSTFLTIMGTVEAGSFAVTLTAVTPTSNRTVHVGASGVLRGNLGIGSPAGETNHLTVINDGLIEAKAGPVLRIGNVASIANNGMLVGSIEGTAGGTGIVVNSGIVVGDVNWRDGGRVIVDNHAALSPVLSS